MLSATLQALLAPTWVERAAAEDELRRWMFNRPVANDPESSWPTEVQLAIDQLQPDAATFLSAVLGFWADVCAAHWHGPVYDLPVPASAWVSLDAWRFPIIGKIPSLEPGRGRWVWQFLERLGPRNASLETQWLACLEHPDDAVAQAAERALVDVPMSNASFSLLLGLLNRGGPRAARRAAVVARDQSRLQHLCQPPPDKASAWLARSEVLPYLPPKFLLMVLRAWKRHWTALPAQVFAELTLALAANEDAKDRWLDEIQLVASHDADLDRRCAATFWLARRGPERYSRRLRSLAHDHPWVLQALSTGLTAHQRVPTGLLRTVARLGLGNECGFDGEPHYAVLELLIGAENRADALPEIHRWLAHADLIEDGNGNYWRLLELVRLAEALGAHGGSLAKYLPSWFAVAEQCDGEDLHQRLQVLASVWTEMG